MNERFHGWVVDGSRSGIARRTFLRLAAVAGAEGPLLETGRERAAWGQATPAPKKGGTLTVGINTDIVSLDLDDPERVSEWRRLALECAPVLPEEAEARMLYECGGGVNSFAIDPYGDLSICVLSHFDRYNVATGTVRVISSPR